ncbi:MAG: hypothetical protein JKY56_03230 [Kofleriaceae bacterium]|nr:hypothetical protein [Kofleriaceae bacterium]
MRGKSWRPGRQTPKVQNGKVQKKHRWDYYFKEYGAPEGQTEIMIVREPAIRRFRHVVSETDLRKFISIVPDWKRYSIGLKALVLGDGDDDCLGWHDEGVICIHAWDSDIQITWHQEFFDEHETILETLMVPTEHTEDGMLCSFTLETARAFLLTHVFLHELGHHYDRMQTKAKEYSPGGESFAEEFSNRLADEMWPDYCRAFDL